MDEGGAPEVDADFAEEAVIVADDRDAPPTLTAGAFFVDGYRIIVLDILAQCCARLLTVHTTCQARSCSC